MRKIKAPDMIIKTTIAYIFLICISFRFDKDIGNQNFLNSSSIPFSSEYCDPNSWLLDTNSVSSNSAVLVLL